MYAMEPNQQPPHMTPADPSLPIDMLMADAVPGPPRKLRRSCKFCRTRKIKCDGQTPCQPCQRKQKDPCIYEEQAQMGRPRRYPNPHNHHARLVERPSLPLSTSHMRSTAQSMPRRGLHVTMALTGRRHSHTTFQLNSPHVGYAIPTYGPSASHMERDGGLVACDAREVRLAGHADRCLPLAHHDTIDVASVTRQQIEPMWLEVRRSMVPAYYHQDSHSPQSDDTQGSLSPHGQARTLQDPHQALQWSQPNAYELDRDTSVSTPTPTAATPSFDDQRLRMATMVREHLQRVNPDVEYDQLYGPADSTQAPTTFHVTTLPMTLTPTSPPPQSLPPPPLLPSLSLPMPDLTFPHPSATSLQQHPHSHPHPALTATSNLFHLAPLTVTEPTSLTSPLEPQYPPHIPPASIHHALHMSQDMVQGDIHEPPH